MRYDANNKRYVTLCNSSTIEPLFFKSHNQILTIILFFADCIFYYNYCVLCLIACSVSVASFLFVF